MTIQVTPTGASCGAYIEGVDLKDSLSNETINAIRGAWLEHHVVIFPQQKLTDADLERYSLCFGEPGDDPFFGTVEGSNHVAAIKRTKEETGPIFASTFHTDWSFLPVPPAATCLYGITIPPVGGNTMFANQHLAYERLPSPLRERVDGLTAIHSARRGYSREGMYGDADQKAGRSMDIRPSDEKAMREQRHPLVRVHPETGRKALFSSMAYIVGFAGMEQEEADELLVELYAWQSRDEFVYSHPWEKDMLVMWDNRSLLHQATGGFEGYDRLLHRTTIADRPEHAPR